MACPNNTQIRRNANDFYDDKIEFYDEAMTEAFQEYFVDQSDGMEVSEMDSEWYQGLLDTFTFPDVGEWLTGEYESFIGDLTDQCYEEYRERRMEDE